jgi:hypothetical protein
MVGRSMSAKALWKGLLAVGLLLITQAMAISAEALPEKSKLVAPEFLR